MPAFARCMRHGGFAHFPAPTGSGQSTNEMVASAGMDLHQPALLPVGEGCISTTHGVITKANVARFVAGR